MLEKFLKIARNKIKKEKEACNMSKKKIEIIDFVELNENGIRVEEQHNPFAIRFFDDNGSLPEGNYDENDIAGSWVVVEGKCEIGKYAYRSSDNCTLIDERDFKNYLINELDYNEEEVEELLKNAKELIRYDELFATFFSDDDIW